MDTGLLEDDVVSMVDVLQEDNELEEEARAVLGDSDDQHCTYPSVSELKQNLTSTFGCLLTERFFSELTTRQVLYVNSMGMKAHMLMTQPRCTMSILMAKKLLLPSPPPLVLCSI